LFVITYHVLVNKDYHKITQPGFNMSWTHMPSVPIEENPPPALQTPITLIETGSCLLLTHKTQQER